MDSQHQTHDKHTLPLVEVFETRTLGPLHETCSAECHAFEMYGARNEMVREAAYLRAQRRGFESGHELEDWLQAERELTDEPHRAD